MTFNIGSQTGGVINNVGGDQHITGGQQGTVVTTEVARRAARELREAVATTRLDRSAATEVRARAEEIEAEVNAGRPDRSRVARALEQLTRLLAAAGSLAAAGGALIGPLHTLAGWLGALGGPVLSLLPLPG